MNAGKDVTKKFDEAGHTDGAKKLMADFLVGEIKEGSVILKE